MVMHHTDAEKGTRMLFQTAKEHELMTQYEIKPDDVNIVTLAEKYARDLMIALFENDVFDEELEDLVAELLPADEFADALDKDKIDFLEEVKDLAQKLTMAQMQIMFTKIFATGDYR